MPSGLTQGVWSTAFLKMSLREGMAVGPEGPTYGVAVGSTYGGWHVSNTMFIGVQGFQRLSSKALAMTLTELSAMAAPAIMGLRYPNAAKGMPATL